MLERRTDLALEAREMVTGDGTVIPGVTQQEADAEGYPLTTVHIRSAAGAAALGKPEGIYHTLDLNALDRRENSAFSRAVRAVSALLTPLLPREGEVLVAGLGNRAITPDALGPLCADRVLVTRHLVELAPEEFGGFRPVSALAPGVLGTTGIESAQLIRAAVDKLRPALVIAIDALAARRLERMCVTVQLSDTGIAPGSGVGNHRFALDRDSLGIPVVAIGVPTVVDGATLAADLLEETGHAPADPSLLSSAPGGTLLVSPRDVDRRVEEMAKVITYGISLALQPQLTLEELEGLVE